MKTKANLTFCASRYTGVFPGGHGVRLTIIDDVSGELVVELDLTLEQWALGSTAHQVTGVRAELGRAGLVGRRCVVREVVVRPGKDDAATRAAVDAEVAKLPPGHDWQPRYADVGNGHRSNRDGTFNVTVRGWEPSSAVGGESRAMGGGT